MSEMKMPEIFGHLSTDHAPVNTLFLQHMQYLVIYQHIQFCDVAKMLLPTYHVINLVICQQNYAHYSR